MNTSNFNLTFGNSSYEFDWETYFSKYNPQNYPTYWREKMIKNSIIIICYSIIFIISLFGNCLVCYVILSTRQMRTVTNFYIANLTISDIMMTLINIPFNVMRFVLDDWPFGELLCKCVPFIQTASVYVSTITMCVIGLDRHQAIVHPFGKRLSAVIPIYVMIPFIWIISGLLSIPHAYFNEVVKLFSYRYLFRCQIRYPEPEALYRQWLTIITFSSQYVIPLSIATICYSKIAYNVHQRGNLGAMTQRQIDNSTRNNRKTIKMLIVVLVVFAICWLPLNLYHIRADFGTDPSRHNLTVYLIVHWLAMSSVCYNPFIYSIRNSYFRKGIKNFFLFIFCRYHNRQNSSSRLREISNTQMTSFRSNSTRVKQQCVVDSSDEAINGSLESNGSKSQNKILEKDSNKTHKLLSKWINNNKLESEV